MEGKQPRASAAGKHRPSRHTQQVLHECDSEDERDGSEESDEAKEIRTKRTNNKGHTDRSESIFQTFGNQTSSGNNTGRLSQNEYLQKQLREQGGDDDGEEEYSELSYDDEDS